MYPHCLNRRTWRGAALALLMFAGAFACPVHASNGVEATGIGLAARSRGGADVAVGDSALSQIANPATLSLTPVGEHRLDFAGKLVFPSASWSGPLDSADSTRRLVPLLDMAYAEAIDRNWSWGIAVHTKSGLSSQYNYRPLMMPWTEHRVGADAKNLGAYFDTAYRVSDRLSLGVGGRAEFITAEFRAPFGPADVKFGRGCAYGGGFQLGLLYKPRDDLSFGLAYRSPTWCTDISGGEVQASLFGLPAVPIGAGNIDDIKLPQRVSGGVAWDVTDRLKLVGEVRWINYANSTWNDMTIAISGPIDARVPLPLGYGDQWVFIVGAEYKLDEHWTLGAGYNHGTNAMRSSHLLPIGSILARDHVSVGLRYARDNWWVGGGYILALSEHMSGGGRSRIPLGVDYALGEVEQTQHALTFGFGFSW